MIVLVIVIVIIWWYNDNDDDDDHHHHHQQSPPFWGGDWPDLGLPLWIHQWSNREHQRGLSWHHRCLALQGNRTTEREKKGDSPATSILTHMTYVIRCLTHIYIVYHCFGCGMVASENLAQVGAHGRQILGLVNNHRNKHIHLRAMVVKKNLNPSQSPFYVWWNPHILLIKYGTSLHNPWHPLNPSSHPIWITSPRMDD